MWQHGRMRTGIPVSGSALRDDTGSDGDTPTRARQTALLNNSKKMLVLLERLYGASIVNLNDTTREKSTEISSQSPVSYFGSWRGFCLAAALRKAE